MDTILLGQICSNCGEYKEISEFYKSKGSKFGYLRKCKKCIIADRKEYVNKNRDKVNSRNKGYYHTTTWRKEGMKKYKENNPEKIKESSDKWRKNNPEKIKERHQKWYKENKEESNLVTKEWRKNNREKVNGYSRDFRKKHKDKVLKSVKKWGKKNPEKVRAYQRKCMVSVRKNLGDMYIRNLLGLSKSDVTQELIETKRLQVKIKRLILNKS